MDTLQVIIYIVIGGLIVLAFWVWSTRNHNGKH
jgi:hypothetical protein